MAWRGCLVVWAAFCFATRLRWVAAQNEPPVSGENDRLPCGQPPSIQNGRFEGYNNGLSVSYSCNDGYMMYTIGSRDRHCTANGSWSGTTPVCSASGCSEAEAPHIPNSSVYRHNSGTVRRHICHAGSEPEVPSPMVAYCDGTRWQNHLLSQCIRPTATTCGPAPLIENARQSHSGGWVTYTCASGYKSRLGAKRIRCGADGQWDASPAVCARWGQGCVLPRIDAVQNGVITIKHSGTVLKIACSPGYELQGSPALFCNGWRWNGTLPTCMPVRQDSGYPATVYQGTRCGTVPRVLNARYRYDNNHDASGNLFYGIIYTCNHGFIMRPANYAVYCSNGNIAGTPPNCLSTCGHQNGGCKQGCRNGDNGVICSCRDGYRLASDGKTCQDFNECSTNNGRGPCQHVCSNSQGSFTCYCHGGYTLAQDKTSCGPNRARCNCGQYGRCVSAFGVGWRCQCYQGYTPSRDGLSCLAPQCNCGSGSTGCTERNGTKICACAQGYRASADGTSCEDIDECQETENGLADCQEACQNTRGSYACSCPQEWLRLAADRRTCTEKPCSCGEGTASCSQPDGQKICTCAEGYRLAEDGSSCVDIDECQESAEGLADCQKACYNTPGSYRCSCPQRWLRLAADQRSCQEIPCSCGSNSISCSQPNGVKTCICADGYKQARNGATCVDRNECQESDPCQGQCTNTWGSYVCRCTHSGYQLAADGHSCEDIDECRNHRLHDCQHACVNIPGSYLCDCPPGNILMPDGRSCQECRPNSYRSATANECLECPPHSQTVGRGKASIQDCRCLPGYTDDYSRDIPCKDIDECEADNGGCKQHCINTPGSFYCACPDGYRLMDDGKTCEDHDECSQSNGGCQHHCLNTVGSFTCTCNEGYAVDPSDPYLCADVNECETGDHDCQQICVNFRGGFQCSCNEGSLLAEDGKTCNPVTCSALVPPERMKVNPRDRCLGNQDAKPITVGFTCKLGCRNGYELQGNANRTCQNTGRWSGEPASCTPVRCPALQPPDHGQVDPPSCLQDGGIEFKGICVYSCDEGYTLIGSSLTDCRGNREWSDERPTCSEVSKISCPRDVSIVLERGESHAVLNLPKPSHTLDRLEASVPAVGHPFPAGRNTVTYTAYSNSTESSTRCTFAVVVIDEEPPVFEFCPDTFTVQTSERYPQIEWDPPVATDNIGVVANNTWISPEGRFTWGTYTVLTDVQDAAGNSASCKFSISIQTVECGEPNGPLNGGSGCSDWMFGRICDPRCNQSHYFFDGPVGDVYLCGFNGVWSPSREVPDCSPYSYLGNQTTCPPGTELKSFAALGDPVCIACPRGYSAAAGSTPSCVPCPTATYQDGFGQQSCLPCQDGHTTAAESAKDSKECIPIAEVTAEMARAEMATTANMVNTTTTATTVAQAADPVPLEEEGIN